MRLAESPDWETDGADWPNRASSRFVDTPDGRWHVQVAGSGPVVLLLHGTGASTHSWRDLLPILATRFTVVAPDLPGHAFTHIGDPAALSLPGMSRVLGTLIGVLGLPPSVAVGHSAGAAVLASACLDGRLVPDRLVSLCGALLPLPGLAGLALPPMARLLSASGLAARLIAGPARSPGAVERLIEGTGSQLDAKGYALYRRLAGHPGHVAGVVEMMARWDLHPLARALPALAVPLCLVIAERDRAIPAADAGRLRRLLPDAKVVRLPGVGHLAHEEQPQRIATLLFEESGRLG